MLCDIRAGTPSITHASKLFCTYRDKNALRMYKVILRYKTVFCRLRASNPKNGSWLDPGTPVWSPFPGNRDYKALVRAEMSCGTWWTNGNVSWLLQRCWGRVSILTQSKAADFPALAVWTPDLTLGMFGRSFVTPGLWYLTKGSLSWGQSPSLPPPRNPQGHNPLWDLYSSTSMSSQWFKACLGVAGTAMGGGRHIKWLHGTCFHRILGKDFPRWEPGNSVILRGRSKKLRCQILLTLDSRIPQSWRKPCLLFHSIFPLQQSWLKLLISCPLWQLKK